MVLQIQVMVIDYFVLIIGSGYKLGSSKERNGNLNQYTKLLDFQDGRFMLSGIQKFVDWIDHPDRDIIDDVKNAVMLERDEYIKKCVDWLIFGPKDSQNLKIFLKYMHSGKQRRFNPERCIHYMYEMHDDNSPMPFWNVYGCFC